MSRMFTTGAVTLALALLIGAASAAVGPESTAVRDSLLARFLDHDDVPLSSYRAVRHLSASNPRYRLAGWIAVETEMTPTEGLTARITSEGGSELLRTRVLRKIIEREVNGRKAGEFSRGDISPANYEFGPMELEDDMAHVAILPRRRDEILLEGRIVLTRQEADLVRIEGRLAKNPSFWTRRVDVVRRYARLNGVRVPVEMTSTAHVLIAGVSSFTMCYDYESVNDTPVIPRISCPSAVEK